MPWISYSGPSKAGSKQEVVETLGMATYMGGGPSLMYAADALSAFEQAQA